MQFLSSKCSVLPTFSEQTPQADTLHGLKPTSSIIGSYAKREENVSAGSRAAITTRRFVPVTELHFSATSAHLYFPVDLMLAFPAHAIPCAQLLTPEGATVAPCARWMASYVWLGVARALRARLK
jgi:hypothetical protein